MSSNQKLTKILAGRSLSGTGQAGNLLTIIFDDGSTMKIKTAPSNSNIAATGGKIAEVSQDGTELGPSLAGGASIKIELAAAADSVALHDRAGKLEYAD